MGVMTLSRRKTAPLEVPPAKWVLRYEHSQAGSDTIQTYFDSGWSLAICCRNCMRLIEWKPDELREKFGAQSDIRIANLAARLTCARRGVLRVAGHRGVPLLQR